MDLSTNLICRQISPVFPPFLGRSAIRIRLSWGHARQSFCRLVLCISFAFTCMRSRLTLLLICPIIYQRNIQASRQTPAYSVSSLELWRSCPAASCGIWSLNCAIACPLRSLKQNSLQPVLLQGTSARILETRKTAPGLRLPDKWAVLIGGGSNHRIGLFDMVMIKDNHVTSAGGVVPAIQHAQVCYRVIAWLISF